MGPLITVAQAQALLPVLSPIEAAAITGLIGPASYAVESYCRRNLAYGTYVEYQRPGLTRKIRLNNWPVAPGSLDLRTSVAQICALSCTDTAAQRAVVSMTAASLTLSIFRSGAPSPTALTLASYATVTELQTAVNNTAGWSMSIDTGHENWLVSDLEPTPGAMSALGRVAGLVGYVQGISLYAMDDPSNGIVELVEDRPQEFRFADRAYGGGYGYGGFMGFGDPRHANVRCAYAAGYDPAGVSAQAVPLDLQLAVALTVKASIDSGQFSGVISKADLGNTSVEIGDQVVIPKGALGRLSPYRNRRF